MKINQLIEGIKSNEMVIPEFQREYVWSLEFAKQLFVSLFKSYPTGSLLFWNTENPPEIKNDAVNRERIGLTKVILDGQQRLTTLYLIIVGQIPPYYTEEDLVNDPRHLYFNLKTGEFLYFMKTKMETNPFWKKVTDCFIKNFDAFTFMEELQIETAEEKIHIGNTINKNLNKIRGILDIDYPIQEVPSNSTIDEAIDVFDRVNSKGTKLSDAELVLTHITGKWSQARRIIKEKIDICKQQKFYFSLDFFTRCIVVSVSKQALYKGMNYSKYSKDDYITAWEKVSKTFDYLIPILKQNAFINGSNDLNTINVLVPVCAFLLENNIQFLEQNRNGFLYWMFLASIWSRYSGQTDQRLNKDVYIAINSSNPINELIAEIEDQRGRIEVKPVDLEGRTAGHPLYKMLYIITKSNKAIDWSNGGSIYDTIGDYYSIQSHHIFPQSFLYKNGYNSENHIDKKKVNEIANRAFITRDANLQISAKDPKIYLTEINEKYPKALSQQFIPQNTELWDITKYEEFLIKRRTIIANEINSFLLKVKQELTEVKETKNWSEIIQKGESDFTEFKSSLRWDYRQNQINKKLEYVVIKTISAFLNSEGGRLIIGIDDNSKILGLTNDYKTFSKKSKDGFLLKMDQLISLFFGGEFHQFLSVSIEQIDNKDICIVEISKSNIPVYIKSNGKEEFYIRASASSQPLGLRESNDYISIHWND